jgi:hypothetical protein
MNQRYKPVLNNSHIEHVALTLYVYTHYTAGKIPGPWSAVPEPLKRIHRAAARVMLMDVEYYQTLESLIP